MTAGGLGVALLQVLLVGAGGPLLVGGIRALKARLQGRQGASPIQPYRDLRKLLVKEVVVAETTSWVFRATPFVLASVMLTVAAVVPLLDARPALGFAGNIVLVMYLLLLGTFFLGIAGSAVTPSPGLSLPSLLHAAPVLIRRESLVLQDAVEETGRRQLLLLAGNKQLPSSVDRADGVGVGRRRRANRDRHRPSLHLRRAVLESAASSQIDADS